MLSLLRENESVTSVLNPAACQIRRLLGSGGQGEVYLGFWNGLDVAVKWYNAAAATPEQRTTIVRLIEDGPPDPRFLWPLDLVELTGSTEFGYIMPLRDSRFAGIPELLNRTVEPSFRAIVTAGFQLADCYLKLHSRGRCYKDINWGNVFLDPESGDVLICDNDNVSIDAGAASGIEGTLGFTAPEVLMQRAMPGIQTDLFSLSVLLFYLFFIGHPLEGEREAAIPSLDVEAKRKLYGSDPVFIFDPKNSSNRPVPGIHDNPICYWEVYPQFLRKLFTQAFTEGLRDPVNGRVRESEWRKVMAQLLDCIVPCQKCGAENFYDTGLRQFATDSGKCWNPECRTQIRTPLLFQVNEYMIAIHGRMQIRRHHIERGGHIDLTKVIAVLIQNPKDPQIWGLRNESNQRWTHTAADGRIMEINPGQAIRVSPGLQVHFGSVTGEVVFGHTSA